MGLHPTTLSGSAVVTDPLKSEGALGERVSCYSQRDPRNQKVWSVKGTISNQNNRYELKPTDKKKREASIRMRMQKGWPPRGLEGFTGSLCRMPGQAESVFLGGEGLKYVEQKARYQSRGTA